MSDIGKILSRMMNDSVFAEGVFTDPEKTLAEYDLPPGLLEEFKNISRADFEKFAATSPEERKSLASGRYNYFDGRFLSADD